MVSTLGDPHPVRIRQETNALGVVHTYLVAQKLFWNLENCTFAMVVRVLLFVISKYVEHIF